MSLFDSLAGAFIDTFGITKPTEKTRRAATWFILGMLLLVVVVLAALGVLLFRLMHT